MRHPLLGITAALALAGLLDAVLLHAWGQGGARLGWTLAGAHVLTAMAAGLALLRGRRRLLQALGALATQTDDLGEGRFSELRQPPVRELQPLAKALNVASARLRALLDDREQRLGALREHVDHDTITGLGSGVFFASQLQARLAEAGPRSAGALAVVRVDDLLGLNRRLGRERADELLRAVAALLRLRLAPLGPKAVAARLNGADFAVLVPGVEAAVFTRWLSQLARALDGLRTDLLTDRPQTAWVGATTYAGGDDAEQVMSRADAMLQACERVRAPWKLTTAAHPLHSLATSEWRTLIESALDTGRITLQPFDVMAPDLGLLHHEAMVRLQLPDGRTLAGEDIVPPATRTGRTVDIDLRVVDLALAFIAEHGMPVAVNVSPHSAGRPSFVSRLAALLDAAGDDAALLSLELDEAVLIDGRDDLQHLAAVLAPHGTQLGIDHFQDRLTDLPGLGAMRLHYVKLDAGCLRRLHGGAGGRRFVELCRAICRAEGLRVIACGVDTETDFAAARSLKLDGYTGQAVRRGLPVPDAMPEPLPGIAGA